MPSTFSRAIDQALPALASSARSSALTLANQTSFGGVTVSDTNPGLDASNCGGCVPPDVQIASGPTQEVEMVNLGYEVFDLNGTVKASGQLAAFFSSGSDFLSDPKVLYDNLSGRWFASILDYGNAGYILLGASASSDALGNWTIYRVPAPSNTFTDQPILGVSSKAIGLTGDIFAVSNSAYYGSELWVVNKSDAMAGSNLTYSSFGPDGSQYQLHAVQSITSSNTLYFAMTSYTGPTSAVELVAATGVPPDTVFLSEHNLTVGTIGIPPSAPQPSTSSTINPGDARIQSAIWRAGQLWVTFGDACQPPNDTATRGCARLVLIDTTNLTVSQDFDVGFPGGGLYYPALSVADDGGLILVVGVSSMSIYPSVLATGRLIGEPADTLEPARFVVNGTASLTCGGDCRFGDYFGAAESPASAGAWVAGEYAGTSTVPWRTAIGFVRDLGPPAVNLTLAPLTADAGQWVNVTIEYINAPCTPGTEFRCTMQLSLPDGVPTGSGFYELPCGFAPSNATIGVQFPLPGNFTLGEGSLLEVYNSTDCLASSLVGEIAVTPAVVMVSPLPSVTVAASRPSAVDVGQVVTFTGAVAGGASPFSYAWTALPTGCEDSRSPVEVCNATAAGSVTVVLSVVDARGALVQGTLQYRVNPAPSVDLALGSASVDIDSILFLTALPAGGSGIYDYTWQGLPTGCSSLDSNEFGCMPSVAGGFTVGVSVTDSLGMSATSAFQGVSVVPKLTVSLTASPSAVNLGDGLLLRALPLGGVGPFSFAWTGLPAGCGAANGSVIQCSPAALGFYRVQVVVADNGGGIDSAAANVSVIQGVPSSSFGPFVGSSAFWLGGAGIAGAFLVVGAVVWARRRRTRRQS